MSGSPNKNRKNGGLIVLKYPANTPSTSAPPTAMNRWLKVNDRLVNHQTRNSKVMTRYAAIVARNQTKD